MAGLCILAYAIIKYHLLDIKIAVTRGGIFAVVYILVLGVPFWLGYVTKSWLIPTTFMAIFATLGPYLYSYFRRQTEMRLRREEFAQHKALRILSQNMLRFTKLDTLLKMIVHTLVKVLKLKHVCVYLKNPESADYELKSAWGIPDKPVLPEKFAKEADFIKELWLKKSLISWRQQEGFFEPGLIIPVFLHDEILGFFVLGEKRSNAIFTQDDINILLFLANQASLAIENAHFLQEQEAKAMDRSKEQLARDIAYGVSHQFNNRLYIMGLMVEPILLAYKDKGITSLTKEEQETFFSKSLKAFSNILQQVKEGGQIAQGIMGFATISKKGDFEKLDIIPLIERALQAAQLKHSKSTIEGLINCPVISNNLPKEAPFILANPSQAQDVFFVLFDNALDALEDNSISQSLKGASFTGRITISLQISDSHIRIVIEDNGAGIRPEHMKRLFLPYFTTKKATDIKGRGLGLSIIKQFVQVNKGRVYAESEYGSWTRFVVEFPIAK